MLRIKIDNLGGTSGLGEIFGGTMLGGTTRIQPAGGTSILGGTENLWGDLHPTVIPCSQIILHLSFLTVSDQIEILILTFLFSLNFMDSNSYVLRLLPQSLVLSKLLLLPGGEPALTARPY